MNENRPIHPLPLEKVPFYSSTTSGMGLFYLSTTSLIGLFLFIHSLCHRSFYSSRVTTIMLFILHTLTNEEQMSTLPHNMMSCQPFEGCSSAYCVDFVIVALLLVCLYC
jgi:hypothetical protein